MWPSLQGTVYQSARVPPRIGEVPRTTTLAATFQFSQQHTSNSEISICSSPPARSAAIKAVLAARPPE